MSGALMVGLTEKDPLRWKNQDFLDKNKFIMNADVRYLFAVSPATANRILAELVAKKKLLKKRQSGHWAYEFNPDFSEKDN